MSSSSATTQFPALSLHAANVGLEACQSHSNKIKVPMNIAIMDPTLHLLAFARMPGAKLTSIDVAINKAFTAAGHRLPTSAYTIDMVGPGAPMYGINFSNGGKFTTIGGGIPVEVDGVVLGAVGCSTGNPDQDMEVAQKGVDAILNEIKKQGGLKAKL